jgi:hypothetical protein
MCVLNFHNTKANTPIYLKTPKDHLPTIAVTIKSRPEIEKGELVLYGVGKE